MDDLNALTEWLKQGETWLTYLTLGAISAFEYVFPPLPGDLVILAGAYLTVAVGYEVLPVYLALNGGSIVGATIAYLFGRWLAKHRERWPRFMRSPKVSKALDAIGQRFERYGPAYLTLNRFVPGLRGVVLVGAGVYGLRAWATISYACISAFLWNAMLLFLGIFLGGQLERMAEWLRRYTIVVLITAAVGAIAYFALRRLRTK